MAKRESKSPTWADVKRQVADFDKAGLLSLVHGLYAANKDNQTFLHARLGLGEDVLKPYKEKIARWISPDIFCKETESISKAKQAISDYRKAVGDPAGLAELMVFFCERATGFCNEYGNDDWGYYSSLLSMFGQAVQRARKLPASGRDGFVARLDRVRVISHKFGYGVGEEMDSILATDTGE
jgi:hypothetical protein